MATRISWIVGRTGLELAIALIPFWSARGLFVEGQEYLGRCLDNAQGLCDPVLEAKAWHGLGTLAWLQNDLALAADHLDQAKEIWESIDDDRAEMSVVDVLHALGMVAADGNDQERALEYYYVVKNRIERQGLTSHQWQLKHANVLISLGILLSEAKEFEEEWENGRTLDYPEAVELAISFCNNELARELGFGCEILLSSDHGSTWHGHGDWRGTG